MTARRHFVRAGLLAASLALGGCAFLPSWLGGGSADAAKPAELVPNPGLMGVRQAWSTRLPSIDFPLTPGVAGAQVALAGGDGTVVLLDASTGRETWRANAGARIEAGAGTDGRVVAVVTRANELVALVDGQVAWRERLAARVYTPPLVAGNRVFVLQADRTVAAYDGAGGRRLWTQPRQGEPLVLRQSGVLLAVGDTLVAGQGGRLVGMDPLNGATRWEAPLASSRGTNDVERLVDLIGRPSRVGDSVCARAFQAAIGCADARRGTVAWTRRANGAQGLSGDTQFVVGAEADGRVVAWRRTDGERAWVHEQLLHRGVGTPLVVGESVVVGDAFGYVHVLKRADGTLQTRLATDGSAVAAPPVVAGSTLVVVTRNGGVYGFVPQ